MPQRHKGTQDQVQWKFRCQINQILRLRLGWKQRWSSLYIRTHFLDGKQCYILGISVTKNGCIVSGRSWIHGTSQHQMTSCMAQIFRQRNRVPHRRTDTTMLGQPSCDILNDKSSSRTSNKTYRHSTSLYSRTVWEQGHRTFPHCWCRKPSRSVHQIPASCQSGTIQVQDWTIIVWFSGSVEME